MVAYKCQFINYDRTRSAVRLASFIIKGTDKGAQYINSNGSHSKYMNSNVSPSKYMSTIGEKLPTSFGKPLNTPYFLETL
jgi:hypothetical protein